MGGRDWEGGRREEGGYNLRSGGREIIKIEERETEMEADGEIKAKEKCGDRYR